MWHKGKNRWNRDVYTEMEKPPWLDDEPEVLALLNEFIDRLNNKPSEERQRPISLKLDPKRMPDLFRHTEASDIQWQLLSSLSGTIFDIAPNPKRGLHEPEYSGAKLKFRFEAELTIRDWLGRPAEPPYAQSWEAALERHKAAFADGGACLSGRPVKVPGKSPDDIIGAFAKLPEFAYDHPTLYQLSARSFWGDSKFLKNREEPVRMLFPGLQIRHRPVLVHVYLPQVVEGVLFIENQDTYIRAVEGDLQGANNLAIVNVAGFRGAAQRIRKSDGAKMHYCVGSHGPTQHRYERWWFSGDEAGWPVFFWGDLDFAGMGILKTLRERFGDVRAWEPGYRGMIALVESERGHLPEMTEKEQQVDPGETGCAYADRILLPLMREKGVFLDQEAS